MDRLDFDAARAVTRRRLLAAGIAGGGAVLAGRALGADVDLRLPGGPSTRAMTSDFPQKGAMILQRARPALLETPMEVFQQSLYTPNDRFFVRWHWGDLPTSIDVETYRIRVGGHVERPLSISLAQLLRMPRIELAAVNQCSGNSRGLFEPRVPGAQWGHGAMGNAKWMGVPLRHVLDLAGVRGGAVAVRVGAMDKPLVAGAPDFEKSLALDHARDGEVMLAFAMNGEQLPLLNGFPVRLVVPGWFSTYWMKTVDAIEVLASPDENYWMAKAYKIPTAPRASVVPGSKDFPTTPINRMIPRSWITSVADGATYGYDPVLPIEGIAMGGDVGVARVEISATGGRTWEPAALGREDDRYGFRRFTARVNVPRPGRVKVMARCTNTRGETQPMEANWNPGGYMRNCVEPVIVRLT
ncbi:molybdopterin-dependent oxidoreductase [Sphingomonas mucosissima]|uniref:Sulfoxide reductase catalytic subunit YedY n=1 Tax=Sphingomonas mucosissima TaxID=370959 RepID=A0A245ZJH4_9SPHN|nr:molybdopterin-dependent oxidoreductase [Sphingomonas mucosissima]OWK29893.1 sulfoxide reductase catalytic subunit YedY [Sphingomonas mucosissima]